MMWHRPRIMRYQNPAQRCRKRQYVRIFQPRAKNALRQFKVDLWLSAKDTGHNILIQIGVGKKTDAQLYLESASLRAWASLLDKLSGRVFCAVDASCDSRSWSHK